MGFGGGTRCGCLMTNQTRKTKLGKKLTQKNQTGEKTFAEAGNKRDAEQAAARMLMETLKDKE